MRLDKLLTESKKIRYTLEELDVLERIKNAADFIHVHAYIVRAHYRRRRLKRQLRLIRGRKAS